jgi:hypothetical protein
VHKQRLVGCGEHVNHFTTYPVIKEKVKKKSKLVKRQLMSKVCVAIKAENNNKPINTLFISYCEFSTQY